MKTYILNLLILICLLILFLRCQPQSTEEKLSITSYEVIKVILKNDPKKFESLIAEKDLGVIGKNDEMVGYDVNAYDILFKRYFPGKIPEPIITQLYNSLGQRLVKIQFYKNYN